mgnify:CR=1 FL=1
MNLLFLNAGRRCELINRFRESLRARGDGRIWGSDIDPKAPALQLVDDARIFPHGDADEFPSFLIAFCNDHNVDLVIPTIDPDLLRLDAIRHRFDKEASDCTLLLPSSTTVRAAANKRRSRELFAETDLRLPRIYDVEPPPSAFPVFVRPPEGSAGRGARKVSNRVQLDDALRKTPDLLVEEYIDGPEYTVDVLCNFDGNALIALPRKRVKIRGGEAQISLLDRNDQIESHAKRLAEVFHATGPVTVQFIRAGEHEFVPIELNARMGGGLPLSITAGADWPGWILDLVQGRSFSTDVPIADQLLMTRYDQSFFLSPHDLHRLRRSSQ